MQSVFISTVHHELRTPIAIIKGYASTLGRDDVEWDSQVIRENVAIIEDEADRLTDLVEDLLTASKIQAARELRLNIADTDLRSIAARSVARLESQSKHFIVLSFADNFPLIPGDEIRFATGHRESADQRYQVFARRYDDYPWRALHRKERDRIRTRSRRRHSEG